MRGEFYCHGKPLTICYLICSSLNFWLQLNSFKFLARRGILIFDTSNTYMLYLSTIIFVYNIKRHSRKWTLHCLFI